MESANLILLERRREGFETFYSELMPCLVDFVGKMGVQPAHMVLTQAAAYAPILEEALQNMAVADDDDRDWIVARMGYFIGEYFVQQFAGCWMVNDIPESRYFARYVVGRFEGAKNLAMSIDPLEMAINFVEAPMPRRLQSLLDAASLELMR
jgi:hypothetical protein